jgi:hypothetical protein
MSREPLNPVNLVNPDYLPTACMSVSSVWSMTWKKRALAS